MAQKSLTDMAARNAKGKEKPYKLAVGAGLYLQVMPNGNRYWRMKYRHAGKEKLLSIGVYPEVTLKEACDKRDAARAQLRDGKDPSEEKQLGKLKARLSADGRFGALALEWLETRGDLADSTRSKAKWMLETYAFPWLGKRAIEDISTAEVLSVLRRLEAQDKIESTQRLRQICGQVFRYAVATGRLDRDPTAALRGALKTTKNRHYASITDPAEIGQLLRAIDGYTGQLTTLCALKFAPLVFTRPGELRKAEWSEIDFEAGQWCIPAEKMKMGVAHIVPLSKQALAILRELHPLTSKSRYIFPSVRSLRDPMSENTVNAALRRLGYGTDDMTGHGFRSMASTLLHEMGWTSDAIERQLAHAERNPIKAAYNRAEHLPERRRMMQAWADYLDKLRIGTGKAKLLAVV
ncbi:tyrosine-type recombinase/integrase [Stenotrophomonas maltophilia]|uniref:tyrosine-type recombinase/integrase n=1 Tax=Stenotrophomonas maltophilia TaxID=40324 RepID=UPI0007F93DCE|nr:integrase arm-type DNA-binding domain-containing protein [Stenotrophomonas maltophilia]OBU58222.1 integrase [Stenotrophomonas maltophilia]OBU69400.1 integrase [Stenotrophomonas maltophilia]